MNSVPHPSGIVRLSDDWSRLIERAYRGRGCARSVRDIAQTLRKRSRHMPTLALLRAWLAFLHSLELDLPRQSRAPRLHVVLRAALVVWLLALPSRALAHSGVLKRTPEHWHHAFEWLATPTAGILVFSVAALLQQLYSADLPARHLLASTMPSLHSLECFVSPCLDLFPPVPAQARVPESSPTASITPRPAPKPTSPAGALGPGQHMPVPAPGHARGLIAAAPTQASPPSPLPATTTPVPPTSTPQPAAPAPDAPAATATARPEPTATSLPPSRTPEPTATALPTATPEPTATAMPAPTATALPTATPEPTAMATPEPTATATPEPTATATPEPTATATPEPTATAVPTATPCPVPSSSHDIMLVLDLSDSISDKELKSVRVAIARLLDQVDFTRDRVGLVTFSSKAHENVPLSTDRADLDRALAGLRSNGGSKIADGITTAANALQQTALAGASQPVIVLFTDGDAKGADADVTQAASQAKAQNIRLISVGVSKQPAETLLRAIASSANDYYLAAEPERMPELYKSLALALACQ